MRTIVSLLPALLLAMPAAVIAEDARSIMRKMGEQQIARWSGVNSYAVDQLVMGNRITQTYEKFEIQGADGKTYPAFRLVGQRSGSGECASFLDNYAMGAEMLGEAHASEVERQMQQAGLPPGLLKATGSDPWATMDSRVMMGGVAEFARAGAEAERNRSDGRAEAMASAQDIEEFARRAKLVGQESVDGREAFHLVADGLNRTQQADGQEFTLNTINLWVDTREYVPLRMKIDGVAKSASESRPITIEKFDSDYRTVPGSTMYEPYRQVMRLSGMLDAAQRAEMADAQKQFAEMEQQLQQMPPAQRQMVMQQMGPQMAMMKQMASGGGFEMTTEVQQIVVNPAAAPAGQAGGPCAPTGLSAAPAAPANPATVAVAPQSPEAAKAAQEACLKEKIQQAQAAQQKKRGMGKLLGAVGRAASLLGEADLARTVNDLYSANATAADLADAARDLGLTEDEIAECGK
ncbi:MAG TPA: hypothetical protein VLM41_03550 [Steroidobacteraceae bacterium]|nr:hypothetical protein [Steroidobacteraceae bacterium]